MSILSGILPIVPTPFTADGRVDEGSLAQLMDWYIEVGVDGAVVLGNSSEIEQLTDDEKFRIIEVAVRTSRGRIPVVAGITSTGVYVSQYLNKKAADLGASAVMLAPSFPMRLEEAVFKFYEEVSQVSSLPIIAQDDPVYNNVFMSSALLVRLLLDIPNIQYLKIEHNPTLPKITAVIDKTSKEYVIFGGSGAKYCFDEFERGAKGCISGFPYPEVIKEIYRQQSSGNTDLARSLFYKYIPLMRYIEQSGLGLVARKEIYKLRGLIDSAVLRRPAPKLDKVSAAELYALIETLGLPKDRKPAVLG